MGGSSIPIDLPVTDPAAAKGRVGSFDGAGVIQMCSEASSRRASQTHSQTRTDAMALSVDKAPYGAYYSMPSTRSTRSTLAPTSPFTQGPQVCMCPRFKKIESQ